MFFSHIVLVRDILERRSQWWLQSKPTFFAIALSTWIKEFHKQNILVTELYTTQHLGVSSKIRVLKIKSFPCRLHNCATPFANFIVCHNMFTAKKTDVEKGWLWGFISIYFFVQFRAWTPQSGRLPVINITSLRVINPLTLFFGPFIGAP